MRGESAASLREKRVRSSVVVAVVLYPSKTCAPLLLTLVGLSGGSRYSTVQYSTVSSSLGDIKTGIHYL